MLWQVYCRTLIMVIDHGYLAFRGLTFALTPTEKQK
jgi:hypothetical protein